MRDTIGPKETVETYRDGLRYWGIREKQRVTVFPLRNFKTGRNENPRYSGENCIISYCRTVVGNTPTLLLLFLVGICNGLKFRRLFAGHRVPHSHLFLRQAAPLHILFGILNGAGIMHSKNLNLTSENIIL